MDFGRESGDEALARQMIYDYRQAELPAEDRALCDYAIKLSLAPGKMSEADVAALREHGFSDEQITVAVQVISYFNYINRIAEGLGVDDESWMDVPHDDWHRNKGSDYLARLSSGASES